MLIPDAATEAFRRRAAMQCSQRSHRAVADVASWVATGFSGVPESFDELVGVMITVLDMNGFKDARARSSSAFGIGLGYRPAIQQGRTYRH